MAATSKIAVIAITNGPAAGSTSIPNAIIRRNIVINVCEPIVIRAHFLWECVLLRVVLLEMLD